MSIGIGSGPPPTTVSYVDYLNNVLPQEKAEAEERKRQLQAALAAQAAQAAKNRQAPTVSGGTYSGNTANFKVVGGKVLPIGAKISQGWGASRIHYAAGRHTGMDFGAPIGTPVRSAANGIVSFVGNGGAYGNMVKVRQADGTIALYGHLSGAGVKPGQRVRAGQRIASSGNSGRSTGAHLHFEIRNRDRYGGDINPVSWYNR